MLFIIYYLNPFHLFVIGNELTFISIVLSCIMIEFFIQTAKSGEKIYMRPIPAMKAMEEAVGRATEMGSSVLYVPGISGLDQIDTISGVIILGHVAARHGIPLTESGYPAPRTWKGPLRKKLAREMVLARKIALAFFVFLA